MLSHMFNGQADNGLCVNNTTMVLSLPPCIAGQAAANGAPDEFPALSADG